MIQVIAVEVVAPFCMDITFSGGELRRFNMQPFLHYPVFRRLEEASFFALARVDYGTVVWPGDIDIAPETLYDFSNLQT